MEMYHILINHIQNGVHELDHLRGAYQMAIERDDLNGVRVILASEKKGEGVDRNIEADILNAIAVDFAGELSRRQSYPMRDVLSRLRSALRWLMLHRSVSTWSDLLQLAKDSDTSFFLGFVQQPRISERQMAHVLSLVREIVSAPYRHLIEETAEEIEDEVRRGYITSVYGLLEDLADRAMWLLDDDLFPVARLASPNSGEFDGGNLMNDTAYAIEWDIRGELPFDEDELESWIEEHVEEEED